MGRSLKKGPFVDHHLRAKFEKMNREGAKRVIKTWWVIRSMYIMGKSSLPFTCPKIWLVIGWESFLQREFSRDIRKKLRLPQLRVRKEVKADLPSCNGTILKGLNYAIC
jgi:hypothetical protein